MIGTLVKWGEERGFYLRRLLDQVEENTNRALGVPRHRTVTKN
jgi:hypothetical protein